MRNMLNTPAEQPKQCAAPLFFFPFDAPSVPPCCPVLVALSVVLQWLARWKFAAECPFVPATEKAIRGQ